MLVLAVIDGLGAGGAERSLAEYAQPLRDRGIETVVAYTHARSGAHEALERAGLELIRVRGMRDLRRLLRARRPDLVHATLIPSSVRARLAAVRTGVPVLTSLVNTNYTPPAPLGRRGVRRTVIRGIDGWTARHLNAWFHALTEAVATDAVDNLGIDRSRVTVIGRGRSRERLGWPSPERRDAARAALGVDGELVVAVGRHEPMKGHDVLARAWARVADQRPDAHLLLAGRDGHNTPALDRTLAGVPRVRRLGHVDGIGDLLAAADVFALPSRREGASGALMEALAMGVPIVASDLPALREAVDDGVQGTFVPPDDPAALASAITALLDDLPTRAAMSAAALERFEARYTLDSIVDRMADLYRGLTRTGG